jgi:cytochrome P450
MGEQPGYEDERFGEVVNRMRSNLANSLFKSIFIMFPFLRHLKPLAYVMPLIRQQLRNIVFIEAYISEKIKKHVDNFDEFHEPNNFIEAFLLEQHKLNKQNVKSHTFTEKQLSTLIFELFIAGTDTTSNSLTWSILMLALYPDVQKRCQEEIDSKIGRERSPTMKDKQNTPYISAVFDEVQRYSTLVPMALLHRSFENDTILGYNIPANSFVVPFIYAIHHDPNVWEKPNEFNPKRFLSNDEKLYQPRDELIPFGMGKRICLGESLAKVELYIFFVSLVQKYNFKLHENDLNRLDDILLGSEGTIHSPNDHHIIFTHRT